MIGMAGGMSGRRLMNDVNTAPRPTVHAIHSISQPARWIGIHAGCAHHGPSARTWAMTVTEVTTAKPVSRSSVGDGDAPGC